MKSIKAPVIHVSNAERICFRFLLLTMCLSALLILASTISYSQWLTASRQVDVGLKSFNACEEKLNTENPICRIVDGNYVSFDSCISLRDAKCDARYFETLVENRQVWFERAKGFLFVGVGLLSMPFALFYVIRWVLTGRIRPLRIRA